MPPLDTKPPDESNARGEAYWRSLDELADTPEFRGFLDREFPGGAEMFSSTTRRHFMKVMGASLAMVGLTSCRWPKENILPFANRPDGRTPGVPQQYATTFELAGVGSGLLVTSFDGRPVKVEGNPDHPQNRGATTAQEQALILEMYDPDRARDVIRRDAGEARTSSWDDFAEFAAAVRTAVEPGRGGGLRVLGEASSSNSLVEARRRFQAAFPEAKWYEYEAISRDQEREGARLAFGRPHRARLHLDRAEVIVALDADLFGGHPASLALARDFAAGRRVDPEHPERSHVNRLHVVESSYSLTGGMADHRHVASARDTASLGAQLALAVREKAKVEGPTAAMDSALGNLAGRAAGAPWIDTVAADLAAHRGRSLIVAGPRQPAAVHALVHWLNAALGNVGKTVDYAAPAEIDRPTHTDAIRELAAEMAEGKVETLVLLGGNPVFDAPADLDFAGKLARVKHTVHLGLHENETSTACTWSLPRAHPFEAWGDARAFDGTLGLTQPLIAPLFDGKTPQEVVSLLLGENRPGYDLVRETFRGLFGASGFESRWRRALHAGFVADSAWPAVTPAVNEDRVAEGLARLKASSPAGPGAYELVFAADPKLHDGRFANNGWLQELPEPITKLTWDNAALISRAAASRLGVGRNGVMIRIRHHGHELTLPAFIQPGQAENTVVLWLGQGRTRGGRVAIGVGFDTFRLRTAAGMEFLGGVSVEKAAGFHTLATTQDHHAMDSEVGRKETQARARRLVQETTLRHYQEHPDFARHAGPHVPEAALWDEKDYGEGHRFGMAIDLNVCTGCSACVVACQAENNIPVVGKDEVRRGREMHWLRVDRYFKGRPEAPDSMTPQPVPCMQCENAPCEQVCPVAATVHSKDGLNDMVYNRCIGTRYCSNNCPFKVRRFNWFLNQGDLSDVEKMRQNPEVTVRARGVMEKCTYCVQRISAVKIKAKNERRPIKDGEITTACAQACPTDAIVFGDLNDKRSRVGHLQAENRCYGLLDEYKVAPRTKYLARIKNPASDSDTGEKH